MEMKKDIVNTELKVLVLEDSLQDLELIRELLSDAGYILDLTHVENEAEFSEKLKENCYDIILSDFKLPGFDAFGALEISQKICPKVPFICVSGSIGEETAIELLKLGAVDYVLKDKPDKLPFSVKRALDEAKEKAALHKAEGELKESEEKFRNIFHNHTAVKLILDPETGKIIEANKSAADFYGWSVDELQQMTLSQINIVSLEMLKQAMEEAQKQKKNQFEIKHTKADGSVVDVEIFSSIIDFGGKHFLHTIIHDISDRKKMLEELLIAKEKAEENDKLKTAFINNISHEIRTPLNGILGFGQLLADDNLSAVKRKEYYNIIKKSGDRLMNTVTDFMDMAMLVSGTMKANNKEFALKPFFEDLIKETKLLFIKKDINFTIQIPEEHPDLSINSDLIFIRKILIILLNNAFKFTKEGSIICGYRIVHENIEFFVQDTGSGISHDKLNLIFEVFTQEDTSDTRGFDGSGLGLTIAKGLVSLLGGTLTVTSVKGKGSTFTCSIPFDDSRIKELPAATEVTDVPKTKKPLVLVAEDDDLNLLYMDSVLEIIGCDRVHAVNGAEAVDHCRTNPEISIVLMDMKMPVMNGVEATRLIREFKPDLPIVAITAYAMTGDERHFIEAGGNEYLAKPINKQKLLAILKKYNPEANLLNNEQVSQI
jgi:PAS domain S-box-containing protein